MIRQKSRKLSRSRSRNVSDTAPTEPKVSAPKPTQAEATAILQHAIHRQDLHDLKVWARKKNADLDLRIKSVHTSLTKKRGGSLQYSLASDGQIAHSGFGINQSGDGEELGHSESGLEKSMDSTTSNILRPQFRRNLPINPLVSSMVVLHPNPCIMENTLYYATNKSRNMDGSATEKVSTKVSRYPSQGVDFSHYNPMIDQVKSPIGMYGANLFETSPLRHTNKKSPLRASAPEQDSFPPLYSPKQLRFQGDNSYLSPPFNATSAPHSDGIINSSDLSPLVSNSGLSSVTSSPNSVEETEGWEKDSRLRASSNSFWPPSIPTVDGASANPMSLHALAPSTIPNAQQTLASMALTKLISGPQDPLDSHPLNSSLTTSTPFSQTSPEDSDGASSSQGGDIIADTTNSQVAEAANNANASTSGHNGAPENKDFPKKPTTMSVFSFIQQSNNTKPAPKLKPFQSTTNHDPSFTSIDVKGSNNSSSPSTEVTSLSAISATIEMDAPASSSAPNAPSSSQSSAPLQSSSTIGPHSSLPKDNIIVVAGEGKVNKPNESGTSATTAIGNAASSKDSIAPSISNAAPSSNMVPLSYDVPNTRVFVPSSTLTDVVPEKNSQESKDQTNRSAPSKPQVSPNSNHASSSVTNASGSKATTTTANSSTKPSSGSSPSVKATASITKPAAANIISRPTSAKPVVPNASRTVKPKPSTEPVEKPTSSALSSAPTPSTRPSSATPEQGSLPPSNILEKTTTPSSASTVSTPKSNIAPIASRPRVSLAERSAQYGVKKAASIPPRPSPASSPGGPSTSNNNAPIENPASATTPKTMTPVPSNNMRPVSASTSRAASTQANNSTNNTNPGATKSSTSVPVKTTLSRPPSAPTLTSAGAVSSRPGSARGASSASSSRRSSNADMSNTLSGSTAPLSSPTPSTALSTKSTHATQASKLARITSVPSLPPTPTIGSSRPPSARSAHPITHTVPIPTQRIITRPSTATPSSRRSSIRSNASDLDLQAEGIALPVPNPDYDPLMLRVMSSRSVMEVQQPHEPIVQTHEWDSTKSTSWQPTALPDSDSITPIAMDRQDTNINTISDTYPLTMELVIPVDDGLDVLVSPEEIVAPTVCSPSVVLEKQEEVLSNDKMEQLPMTAVDTSTHTAEISTMETSVVNTPAVESISAELTEQTTDSLSEQTTTQSTEAVDEESRSVATIRAPQFLSSTPTNSSFLIPTGKEVWNAIPTPPLAAKLKQEAIDAFAVEQVEEIIPETMTVDSASRVTDSTTEGNKEENELTNIVEGGERTEAKGNSIVESTVARDSVVSENGTDSPIDLEYGLPTASVVEEPSGRLPAPNSNASDYSHSSRLSELTVSSKQVQDLLSAWDAAASVYSYKVIPADDAASIRSHDSSTTFIVKRPLQRTDSNRSIRSIVTVDVPSTVVPGESRRNENLPPLYFTKAIENKENRKVGAEEKDSSNAQGFVPSEQEAGTNNAEATASGNARNSNVAEDVSIPVAETVTTQFEVVSKITYEEQQQPTVLNMSSTEAEIILIAPQPSHYFSSDEAVVSDGIPVAETVSSTDFPSSNAKGADTVGATANKPAMAPPTPIPGTNSVASPPPSAFSLPPGDPNLPQSPTAEPQRSTALSTTISDFMQPAGYAHHSHTISASSSAFRRSSTSVYENLLGIESAIDPDRDAWPVEHPLQPKESISVLLNPHKSILREQEQAKRLRQLRIRTEQEMNANATEEEGGQLLREFVGSGVTDLERLETIKDTAMRNLSKEFFLSKTSVYTFPKASTRSYTIRAAVRKALFAAIPYPDSEEAYEEQHALAGAANEHRKSVRFASSIRDGLRQFVTVTKSTTSGDVQSLLHKDKDNTTAFATFKLPTSEFYTTFSNPMDPKKMLETVSLRGTPLPPPQIQAFRNSSGTSRSMSPSASHRHDSIHPKSIHSTGMTLDQSPSSRTISSSQTHSLTVQNAVNRSGSDAVMTTFTTSKQDNNTASLFPQDMTDLERERMLLPLPSRHFKALISLFKPLEEPAPGHLIPEDAILQHQYPAESRIKERLRSMVTPTEFLRGLNSIGVRILDVEFDDEDVTGIEKMRKLTATDIEQLVFDLNIALRDKVDHRKFAEFVALPMTNHYIRRDARTNRDYYNNMERRKADPETGIVQDYFSEDATVEDSHDSSNSYDSQGMDGYYDDSTGSSTSSPAPNEVHYFPDNRFDIEVLTLPSGVPYPSVAPFPPRPYPKQGPFVMTNTLNQKKLQRESDKSRVSEPVLFSPWHLTKDGQHLKPAAHVPWPMDITAPRTAFWDAVNKLEKMFMDEVKTRAEIKGDVADEIPEATAAGSGFRFQGGKLSINAISRKSSRSIFVFTSNIRRTFQFLDKGFKRYITLDDLHKVLRDLNLVDPSLDMMSGGSEVDPYRLPEDENQPLRKNSSRRMSIQGGHGGSYHNASLTKYGSNNAATRLPEDQNYALASMESEDDPFLAGVTMIAPDMCDTNALSHSRDSQVQVSPPRVLGITTPSRLVGLPRKPDFNNAITWKDEVGDTITGTRLRVASGTAHSFRQDAQILAQNRAKAFRDKYTLDNYTHFNALLSGTMEDTSILLPPTSIPRATASPPPPNPPPTNSDDYPPVLPLTDPMASSKDPSIPTLPRAHGPPQPGASARRPMFGEAVLGPVLSRVTQEISLQAQERRTMREENPARAYGEYYERYLEKEVETKKARAKKEEEKLITVREQLGLASRAMVIALFRRMHGESDPGNSGVAHPLLILEEDKEPLCKKPISFDIFSRWASPLNPKLRRIREKAQEAFLRNASIGGGDKDFSRAFKRIDRNGDGILSAREFRLALGRLVNALDPQEIQALTDYFDCDGNGTIDFHEFLAFAKPESL